MEQMFEAAAGIDVHRDTVVVTVRRQSGRPSSGQQTRTFDTFYDQLVVMASWLEQEGVQVVGLESTGVYWRPVVRVLHERVPQLVVWLVNPAQVRKVPGRKTDVNDSQWLARLVMHGLVAPSFVPSAALQELRKLTRHRTKLTADSTRCRNRVLKELESSGLKLARVCSDPLGKTGRAILDAILAGKALTLTSITNLASGSLRNKAAQLYRAVQGALTPSAHIVIEQLLRQLDALSADIARIDGEIAKQLQPMQSDVDLLLPIPGIERTAAAAILAETGSDMSVFPSPRHLTSWAGLAPGSNESAGLAKRAPTRKGDKYLRTILVQAAVSASRSKGTFWSRRYRQLIRLGPKKAAVALARKLLTTVFHVLAHRVPYQDPDSLLPPILRTQARIRQLTKQITALGYTVTLAPTSGVS